MTRDHELQVTRVHEPHVTRVYEPQEVKFESGKRMSSPAEQIAEIQSEFIIGSAIDEANVIQKEKDKEAYKKGNKKEIKKQQKEMQKQKKMAKKMEKKSLKKSLKKEDKRLTKSEKQKKEIMKKTKEFEKIKEKRRKSLERQQQVQEAERKRRASDGETLKMKKLERENVAANKKVIKVASSESKINEFKNFRNDKMLPTFLIEEPDDDEVIVPEGIKEIGVTYIPSETESSEFDVNDNKNRKTKMEIIRNRVGRFKMPKIGIKNIKVFSKKTKKGVKNTKDSQDDHQESQSKSQESHFKDEESHRDAQESQFRDAQDLRREKEYRDYDQPNNKIEFHEIITLESLDHNYSSSLNQPEKYNSNQETTDFKQQQEQLQQRIQPQEHQQQAQQQQIQQQQFYNIHGPQVEELPSDNESNFKMRNQYENEIIFNEIPPADYRIDNDSHHLDASDEEGDDKLQRSKSMIEKKKKKKKLKKKSRFNSFKAKAMSSFPSLHQITSMMKEWHFFPKKERTEEFEYQQFVSQHRDEEFFSDSELPESKRSTAYYHVYEEIAASQERFDSYMTPVCGPLRPPRRSVYHPSIHHPSIRFCSTPALATQEIIKPRRCPPPRPPPPKNVSKTLGNISKTSGRIPASEFYSSLRMNYKPKRFVNVKNIKQLNNYDAPKKLNGQMNVNHNYFMLNCYDKPKPPRCIRGFGYLSDGIVSDQSMFSDEDIPFDQDKVYKNYYDSIRPSDPTSAGPRPPPRRKKAKKYEQMGTLVWEPFTWKTRRCRSLTELEVRRTRKDSLKDSIKELKNNQSNLPANYKQITIDISTHVYRKPPRPPPPKQSLVILSQRQNYPPANYSMSHSKSLSKSLSLKSSSESLKKAFHISKTASLKNIKNQINNAIYASVNKGAKSDSMAKRALPPPPVPPRPKLKITSPSSDTEFEYKLTSEHANQVTSQRAPERPSDHVSVTKITKDASTNTNGYELPEPRYNIEDPNFLSQIKKFADENGNVSESVTPTNVESPPRSATPKARDFFSQEIDEEDKTLCQEDIVDVKDGFENKSVMTQSSTTRWYSAEGDEDDNTYNDISSIHSNFESLETLASLYQTAESQINSASESKKRKEKHEPPKPPSRRSYSIQINDDTQNRNTPPRMSLPEIVYSKDESKPHHEDEDDQVEDELRESKVKSLQCELKHVLEKKSHRRSSCSSSTSLHEVRFYFLKMVIKIEGHFRTDPFEKNLHFNWPIKIAINLNLQLNSNVNNSLNCFHLSCEC